MAPTRNQKSRRTSSRIKKSAHEWGDPESPICIVAEAPGREEMVKYEPLVGQSGRINDECLHAAGLIRRSLYILNLFDHPIRDGSDYHLKGAVKEDVLPHIDRTIRKIQRSKARVIVTLGALPLAALLGRAELLKRRGSVYQCPFKDDAVIIPTIHPAATMRGTYIWRYLIQADYAKAARLSRTKGPLRPNPTMIIHPSFNECIDFLQYIKREAPGRAAWDVEIYNHEISCISFSIKDHEAISIPFVGLGYSQHNWTIEQELALWKAIAGVIEDPDIDNIGVNIIFDYFCAARMNGIIPAGRTLDAMVGQHILDPDFPKGLDFITSIRTDYEYYKDDRKLWENIREDPDTFYQYSCKDAITTWIGWHDIEQELTDRSFWDMYWYTIRKYNPLLFMMLRGYKVDREELDKTRKEIGKELEAAIKRLDEIADYPFSATSPKQCKEYFYTHKRIKPYTSRSTGAETTDDKAMQRLWSRHGLEEARLVQTIRKLTKLKGTYLDVETDRDDRFRSFYNPRGTRNCRLSGGKTVFGTGGNPQNMHPDFLRFLVAD